MAIVCNAAKKCHASLVAMESQLKFIDVLDDDCLLKPSSDSGEQCKKKRRVLNKQDHLTILHTICNISVNTLSFTILKRTRTKLQDHTSNDARVLSTRIEATRLRCLVSFLQRVFCTTYEHCSAGKHI